MACFSDAALSGALVALAKMYEDKAFVKLDLEEPVAVVADDALYNDAHDIFRAELGQSVREPGADRPLHIRHPIGAELRAADVIVRFDSPLGPLCLRGHACVCPLDTLLALACRPDSLSAMEHCADYRVGPSRPWASDPERDVVRLRNYAARGTRYAAGRLRDWERRALDALCNFLMGRLVLPDLFSTLCQEHRFAGAGVGQADHVAVGLHLDTLDAAQICAGMAQLRATAHEFVCGLAAPIFRKANLGDLWRECGTRAVARYLEFRYATLYVLYAGVRALVHYLACPEPIVYGPLAFEPASEGAPTAAPLTHWYRARNCSAPFKRVPRRELVRAHVLCMQFARAPAIQAAAAELRGWATDAALLSEPLVLGALMWRWFYLHELVPLTTRGRRVHQIQTLSDAAGLHRLPVTDGHGGYGCVVRPYEHLIRFAAAAAAVGQDLNGNSNVVAPCWPWLEERCRALPRMPSVLCANPCAPGGGGGREVAPRWRWIRQRCVANAADQARWESVPAGPERAMLVHRSRALAIRWTSSFVELAPHTEEWMMATRPFLRSVPPYPMTYSRVVPAVVWAHGVPLPPDARFSHVDYAARARLFEPGKWACDAHTIRSIAGVLVAHFVPDTRPGGTGERVTPVQFLALYVYWTRHCQMAAPPIAMAAYEVRRLAAALARHLVAWARGGRDSAGETRRMCHTLTHTHLWVPRPGSVFGTLFALAGTHFEPHALLDQLHASGGRSDELTNVLWDARCRQTAQTFGF